jgi:Flp pilus assembly protein TadD
MSRKYQSQTPGEPSGLLICLLLAALTVGSFYRVLGNGFFNALDDDLYVTQNPMVEAGLTAGGVRWAFTTFHANNWHPLTWLSLQLDAQLFGAQAWGFHLTNLVLHVVNVVLLFGILARITGATWRSAMVAALFAIHPLHVESVAWIAERKDVLSTMFGFLTIGAYAWYAGRPALGRYLVVALLYALGLMAKPMLVTLPFVLLLLDYWPLRRWQPAGLQSTSRPAPTALPRYAPAAPVRLVLEKVPLLVLAAGCATATIQAQQWVVQSLTRYPIEVRLMNTLVAYADYVAQMFWPINLAFYYPHPASSLAAWQPVAAGLLLVAVTLIALREAGSRPYLAVGWFWFLGMLVPVIGLVQVGGQAMADRYTYVPLIGLFLALVWLSADWCASHHTPRAALATGAAVILLACAVLTWIQVGFWQSSNGMLEHTIAVTQDNYRAHINLGSNLIGEGKIREAKQHLNTAIGIKPDEPLAHLVLGMAYYRENRLEEAISCFRKALELKPDLPDAYDNLGKALLRQGKTDYAVKEFKKALELAPEHAEAELNLGAALYRLGRLDEAIPHLEAAHRLLPGRVEPLVNLGMALFTRGQPNRATDCFAAAARMEPATLNQMAWQLATNPNTLERNGPLALAIAQAVCNVTGRQAAQPLHTLAAAQAEVGDFSAAITTARSALALAADHPELAAQISDHIRLFEARQPVRGSLGRH